MDHPIPSCSKFSRSASMSSLKSQSCISTSKFLTQNLFIVKKLSFLLVNPRILVSIYLALFLPVPQPATFFLLQRRQNPCCELWLPIVLCAHLLLVDDMICHRPLCMGASRSYELLCMPKRLHLTLHSNLSSSVILSSPESS